MAHSWRVIDVLKWTTQYFKQKGIDNPRLNAEVLLAHALRTDRMGLYLHYDKPLETEERERYRKYIKRRALGEPVHYITGYREFWSLEFNVNPFVLIPRPETEILVETVLECIISRSYQTVMEVGTGSGAIAVSLAYEIPSLKILATDVSSSAIMVAVGNAKKHGVHNRVAFAVMDYFEGLKMSTRFDTIVSNPPYISDNDYSLLPRDVREHEPPIALRGGGRDGLDAVRKLVNHGLPHLIPGGIMCIEVGFGQAETITSYAATISDIIRITTVNDYARIPRVVCLEKGK